jgi:hypothetical protein
MVKYIENEACKIFFRDRSKPRKQEELIPHSRSRALFLQFVHAIFVENDFRTSANYNFVNWEDLDESEREKYQHQMWEEFQAPHGIKESDLAMLYYFHKRLLHLIQCYGSTLHFKGKAAGILGVIVEVVHNREGAIQACRINGSKSDMRNVCRKMLKAHATVPDHREPKKRRIDNIHTPSKRQAIREHPVEVENSTDVVAI